MQTPFKDQKCTPSGCKGIRIKVFGLWQEINPLGFGDVSWNNPEMITPNLERLAGQGVILNQYYTQPKCSPSRAALMTG